MKKRVLIVFFGASLALSSLSGCASLYKSVLGTKLDGDGMVRESLIEEESNEETSEEESVEETVVSSENEAESAIDESESSSGEESLEEAALKAYAAFMKGEISLATSDAFKEGSSDLSYYGIGYGEYDYNSLKAAIEELEMGDGFNVFYAYVDFGQDNSKELVLRFENKDGSFLNWTGIIKYTKAGLQLTHFYEDGYRSFASLYQNGYLLSGGSMGAGAHLTSLSEFNAKGELEPKFQISEYFGNFATSIIYDLKDDDYTFENDYSELYGSDFLVTEYYKMDSPIKISVSDWSEDDYIRALEESLIEEYAQMGAEIISEEEMTALADFDTYCSGDTVTWTLLEGEPEGEASVGDEALMNSETHVTAEIVTENSDRFPLGYYAYSYDDSENMVLIRLDFDTTIKDFTLVNLTWDSYTEDGYAVYNGERGYSLNELTSDMSFLLGMTFWGDIPQVGIAYDDPNGVHCFKAISMSGYDGSIVLEDALLK